MGSPVLGPCWYKKARSAHQNTRFRQIRWTALRDRKTARGVKEQIVFKAYRRAICGKHLTTNTAVDIELRIDLSGAFIHAETIRVIKCEAAITGARLCCGPGRACADVQTIGIGFDGKA